MRLQATYTLPVPRQRLWALLFSAEDLRACLPGCERLTQVAPDTFEVTLTVGVAAVKGTYAGRLQILDQEPPGRCRLRLEGTGSPGFVRGEASVVLTEDAGGTILAIDADAQVGGVIASVGQRMLTGVARMLLADFVKRVEAHLTR
ncbi:MAG: carbon monoxide dehydrogenase subunit G [candidate division NC10 bacterium]|nr:carbon monoxide dehydrogenase subunit G [candidate division NC10 bacterium]